MDGQRQKLVRCTCHLCGATFWASRGDAKFDKPACRTAAYRWRQRLPVLAHDTRELLAKMWQYLDYPQSRDEAIEMVVQISREIDRGLLDRNVKLTRVR